MKAYYLKNDRGEVYGNARYMTLTGVPKLYGSVKRAQRIIDDAIEMQRYLSRPSSGCAICTIREVEL